MDTFPEYNDVITDFKNLISNKLHEQQLYEINGVFKILTDFNYQCNDFLKKRSRLVKLFKDGMQVKEIYIKYNDYKYNEIIMVKNILEYENPETRPVARSVRRNIHFKIKHLMKHADNDKDPVTPSDAYKILEGITEGRDSFLAKYPDVVELLKEKLPIKKIADKTGKAKNTVLKVSHILKNDPEYLIKHAAIVEGLKQSLTHRKINELTGASKDTVNIVAKLMEINYIDAKRKEGLARMDEQKIKEANTPAILKYCNKTFLTFKREVGLFDVPIFREKFTLYIKSRRPQEYEKKLFETVADEFIESKIKKAIRIGKELRRKEKYEMNLQKKMRDLEKAKERSINSFKSPNELTKNYFKNPTPENLQLLKENGLPIPKTQFEYDEERAIRLRKVSEELLNDLLVCGINPFSEDWDIMPEEYKTMEYKGIYISEYWEDDQKLMYRIRENLPDLKDYAYKNLKEFNLKNLNNLVLHLEKIDTMELAAKLNLK